MQHAGTWPRRVEPGRRALVGVQHAATRGVIINTRDTVIIDNATTIRKSNGEILSDIWAFRV